MQRTGDAGALERLPGGVFGAGRHQARHFGLGDRDFLPPEGGKADIGDGVVGGFGHGVMNSCWSGTFDISGWSIAQ